MVTDIEAHARRRRVWLVLGAVLISVALVVAGVSVGIWLSRDNDEKQAQRQQETQLTWMNLQGTRLPVSSAHGPRVTRDGRAWGFTHDRKGAVLAAAHISMRTAPRLGPHVFNWTFDHQVVGVAASGMRASVASQYQRQRQNAGVAAGKPLPRHPSSTVVGYRVAGDSGSSGPVTVHLLVKGSKPGGGVTLVDVRNRVRWAGGSWRLIAPPHGSWTEVTETVRAPNGYTRFGGRQGNAV